MTDARFKVGKIANTHGLKGDLKIYPYTSTKERFLDFDYLMIEGFGEEQFEIENVRFIKNMVLFRFKGMNHINDVEKYKNLDVYIYRDDEDLEDDDFYIADVIGCECIDENLGRLGKIVDVLQNRSQDTFVVKLGDGREVYIPCVKEYVREIDLEEEIVYVEVIEGMI